MMKFITTLALLWSSFTIANSGNPAFSELLDQADLNNPRAQYQLYQAYLSGDGVTQSPQEALYWLKQAALNRYKLAQYDLVEQYLTGGLTKPDINKAVFWLTKLAISGDDKAQYELGQIYEKRAQSVDTLSQAKLWYQMAAESYPDAELALNRLLEQEFNQQRAKQLAQLDQLNSQNQTSSGTLPSWFSAGRLSNSLLLTLCISTLIALGFVTVIWRRKQRSPSTLSDAQTVFNREPDNGVAHPDVYKLKNQLAQQTKQIHKQKQQIEALYGQLKSQQLSTAQASQTIRPVNNSFSLACAMFGFEENQLPEAGKIKLRYKQLCKIYHPDLKGSDDEMKRLNQALKTILDHLKKSR
ncbi:J domain-containing protein [Vibrio panuliri]|nr:J domain-containing protein [Vibrio panuliri]KAB1454314.1 hypothetical protein F7O85_15630 [Vibrio panuliri]